MTSAHTQGPESDSAPLISLLVPSRRPRQFEGLIKSLHESVSDHRSVEVLAKIDDDDPDAVEDYKTIARNSSISCRLVIGPRLGGVFTLWVGMEDALIQADNRTYFVIAVTDEGRFLTKGWDEILRTYVGYFEDHAFRLRLSKVTALIQYANLLTCSTMPESFAIFTRRWLELTEGFTRFSYGFDAYQQAIATRLAIDDTAGRDIWNSRGRFRDVPIYNIDLGGIEFGKDISEIEAVTRMTIGTREWLRLLSYREQEHISYLATRLRLYIWSKENWRGDFHLHHNKRFKTISVVQKNGLALTTGSYRISRLRTYWFYGRVLLHLMPTRINYFRHEIMLSRRLRARPKPQIRKWKPQIRKWKWNGFRSWRGSQRFARVVPRPILLWVDYLFAKFEWMLLKSKMWMRRLLKFRTSRRRLLKSVMSRRMFLKSMLQRRRLRRRMRMLHNMSLFGMLFDLLFYPVDRLLWTPPVLCDAYSAHNPLSTLTRLKRLGYPVAPREKMLEELKKIEKLKSKNYCDIVF